MDNIYDTELGVVDLILLFFIVVSLIDAMVTRSLWLEETRYKYISNRALQRELKNSYRRSLLFSLIFSIMFLWL